MDLPKGSWIESARNVEVIDENHIRCQLKRMDGQYQQQELIYNPEDEYANIDGHFSLQPQINASIPKKIYQTHKSWDYVMKKKETRRSVESWQRQTGFEYNFFDDIACDRFVKENFDDRIYQAYRKCPRPVMKADLWRYCVIYKNGGIYADTDAVLKCDANRFLISNTLLVLAPEYDNIHLCQWTFAAPAGSEILKTIIDMSVERIMNETDFYKQHIVHYLTGPRVFTDGIEKYLRGIGRQTFKERRKYEIYRNDVIHVIKAQEFHGGMIEHLFAGSHSDGWKKI